MQLILCSYGHKIKILKSPKCHPLISSARGSRIMKTTKIDGTCCYKKTCPITRGLAGELHSC